MFIVRDGIGAVEESWSELFREGSIVVLNPIHFVEGPNELLIDVGGNWLAVHSSDVTCPGRGVKSNCPSKEFHQIYSRLHMFVKTEPKKIRSCTYNGRSDFR